VGLDPRAPSEGQLDHGTSGVAVDRLAAHAFGTGRTLRSAMADAEAADLDGHSVA
jgi:hypothetical protein